MGIADDFMNSFLAAYPEAGSGKLNLEELNRLIEIHQQKINSSPLNDFDGLSPQQMALLLDAPLSEGSILQLRKGMEKHVDKAPFFKLSEILLDQIQLAGKLKLTVKGNLPIHICKLLCQQDLIYWPYMKYVKVFHQEAVPFLLPLKQYLLDEKLVVKKGNDITLTTKGKAILKGPKELHFVLCLNYLTSRFHWGNFYSLEDDGKSGQFGWAYSLLLLSKYGSTARDSRFYSSKLMQAFEQKLGDGQSEGKDPRMDEDYHYAYSARFFKCFAVWFGLVNIERKPGNANSSFDELFIMKSDLFDQLFEVASVKE